MACNLLILDALVFFQFLYCVQYVIGKNILVKSNDPTQHRSYLKEVKLRKRKNKFLQYHAYEITQVVSWREVMN